jgi:ubiquinol-cytochrome c reductase cytochrome c subunit
VLAALIVSLVAGLHQVVAQPSSTSAPPAERGAQIWTSDCAFCHGPTGKGTFQGPDITQAGTAAVSFQVSTGRMPKAYPLHREKPTYSPADIQALVQYTTGFVTGPAVPSVDVAAADVANGGELYRLNCAACHQMVGSGGVLAYDVVVPSLHESTPAQVVEAMRTGPGQMPVFDRTTFSDAEAADIAAYVNLLHHPDDRGGLNLGHFGPVPEGLVAITLGLGAMVLITRLLGTRSRPPGAI